MPATASTAQPSAGEPRIASQPCERDVYPSSGQTSALTPQRSPLEAPATASASAAEVTGRLPPAAATARLRQAQPEPTLTRPARETNGLSTLEQHAPTLPLGDEVASESAADQPSIEQSGYEPGIPLGDWRIVGDAVVGLAHRKRKIPCQDAVFWRTSPRPILALSDGAGSGVASELGARALVMGATRLIATLEEELVPWLDGETPEVHHAANRLAAQVLTHAQGLLEDLATTERRSIADIRGTLLLAVFGRRKVFWWQVGDGATVCVRAEESEVLGDVSRAKGEYANQTCFVDRAGMDDIQHGVLDTERTLALALMSDGAAERLVSSDGQRVAHRLRRWSEQIAEDALSALDLAVAFHEPAFVGGTTLDDRSIVMAARPVHPGGSHTSPDVH